MPAAASVSVQLALSKPTNVASLGTLRKGSTHTVAAVMAQREKQQTTETDNRTELPNRAKGSSTGSPLRNRIQKTTAAISYEDVVKLNELKNKWRPVKKSAINRRDLSVKSKQTAHAAANTTSNDPPKSSTEGTAAEFARNQLNPDVAPLVCPEPSSISKAPEENPASATVTATTKSAPPAKWHHMPIFQETYGGGFNRTSWVREDQVEFCRSDEEFYAQLRDAVAGREPTQLPPFDPATLKLAELDESSGFDPLMFPNIMVSNSNMRETEGSDSVLADADLTYSSSSVSGTTPPRTVTPRHASEVNSTLAVRPVMPTIGSTNNIFEDDLLAAQSMPLLLAEGEIAADSMRGRMRVAKIDDADEEEDFCLVIRDEHDDDERGRNLHVAGDAGEMTPPRSSPAKARASTANTSTNSRKPKASPSNNKRSRSESSKSRSTPITSSSKKKKKKVITLGSSFDTGSSSASHLDERSNSTATPVPRSSEAGDSNDADDTEMPVESGEHPCGFPGCGKVFGSHDGLRKHLKTHRVRDFVCDQCGKSFLDKSKLNRHQLVHSGQKAFECEICGKKFSLEYNMRTHQRIHSGERPFECFCKRSFAQSTNLKNHLLTHVKKGEIPSDQAEDYILRLYKRGPRKDIVIEVPDLDGAEGDEMGELDEGEHDSEDEDGLGRLEVDDGGTGRRPRLKPMNAGADTSMLPMDNDSGGGITVLGEETGGLISSEAMLL